MHPSLDTLSCNIAHFWTLALAGLFRAGLFHTRHVKQTLAISDLSDQRIQELGTRPDSVNWPDGSADRPGTTPLGASPTNLGYIGELMRYDSEAVPRWDD
jgi:hypothetical protein